MRKSRKRKESDLIKDLKEECDRLTRIAKINSEGSPEDAIFRAEWGALIWIRLWIDTVTNRVDMPEVWEMILEMLANAMEETYQESGNPPSLDAMTDEQRGTYMALDTITAWMIKQGMKRNLHFAQEEPIGTEYEIQIEDDRLAYVSTKTGQKIHQEIIVLDEDGNPYIPLRALLMIQTLKNGGLDLLEIIPAIPMDMN